MNDTTTPPPPPPGSTSGPDRGEPDRGGPDRDRLRSVAEARRSTDGRLVAGVSAGIGRHLGVDPIIVRIVFVALTFAGLAGVILYATAWFVMPSDDGRRSVMADWFGLGANEPQARTAVLVVGGALAFASVVGDTGWFWGVTWPLFTLWLVVPALFFYWLFAVLPRQRGGSDARPVPPVPPVPPRPPSSPAGVTMPAAGTGSHGDTGRKAPLTDGPAPEASGTDETGVGEIDETLVLDQDGDTPPPPPVMPPAPSGDVVPPVPPAPRTPPLLFLATMSITALAIGIVALVDVTTGHDLPPELYAAMALGLTGVGLLVGARWGRSVALVPVGLVLAFALAVTAVFPHGPAGDFHHAPSTAMAVDPMYDLGAGQLELDLTAVADPEDLLGRTITIDGGLGQIRVIVPHDLNVAVHAYVTGGDITIFGQNTSGHQAELDHPADAGPRLTLDITHTFGQITVVESS